MSTLAAYRTRIFNSLVSSTTKYSNDIIDEALRKILNEYTRAFPLAISQSITLAGGGRNQSLAACANLMSVISLVHPYNSALTDPYIYKREDFMLNWDATGPNLFFTGTPIPLTGEKMLVTFAARQTIKDLDTATSTTVRDDHEDLLVVGAAAQAAMMRASGLNEQWGTRPTDYSQLMLWGKEQYARFADFLLEIRTEQPLDIFPADYWKLDKWDKH
jgi:hypothetical protein